MHPFSPPQLLALSHYLSDYWFIELLLVLSFFTINTEIDFIHPYNSRL